MLGQVLESTEDTLIQANMLLHEVKKDAKKGTYYGNLDGPDRRQVDIACWSDAARANIQDPSVPEAL